MCSSLHVGSCMLFLVQLCHMQRHSEVVSQKKILRARTAINYNSEEVLLDLQ
uniref:Uncharacterized protein n=1 Tax=Anguilla anguilla TaxID=7936 RepID=A0A0E9UQ21_ANGAN